MFREIWDGMRALVVLFVFYELFIANKFQVAMRIIAIQSSVNISVYLQYKKQSFRSLQTIFLNSKIGFLYQIEETRYLLLTEALRAQFL